MSVEHDIKVLTLSRIEDIFLWAKHKTWFDTSFIEDIYSRIKDGKNITQNQCSAIERIHNKFIK